MECAPPDCYQSCSLYEVRADLKCARFVTGIVPNVQVRGIEGGSVEVFFRRWAKLETKFPEFPRLFPVNEAISNSSRLNAMERRARRLANVLSPLDKKRKVQGAQYAYHQKIFPGLSEGKSKGDFDGFYLEIYSEVAADFSLELSGASGVLMRHAVNLEKGWNRLFIDREQWPVQIPGGALLRLVNNGEETIGVVISALHLLRWKDKSVLDQLAEPVRLEHQNSDGLPQLKCVVFDLDNTLWSGVIGDDGMDGVTVRQEVVKFIHALDARGIICAVASKNEQEIALAKIEALGLTDFLLFPQIHWGPKSHSIKLIAEDMNVSLNTLAFIDDNPFERAEVQKALPMVRVYPESNVMDLLNLEDFDVPVTEQAAKRRLSYLAESKRVAQRASSAHDVDAFLRSCNMKMTLLDPREFQDRCLEMIDRTNQFNISGQKYSAVEFEEGLDRGIPWCWSVKDDFGDYGIVGYLHAKLGQDVLMIEDFVMSCRVAQKRVEEALFTQLRAMFREQASHVRLRVVETSRNAAILGKLQELGSVVLDSAEYKEIELNQSLPGNDVIEWVTKS